MRPVFTLICLIFAWRFKVWKSWREYYSTIVFVICVDFLIGLITYNHSLWHFEKSWFVYNHTFTDFYLAFIQFPLIVVLFLSRYPYNSRLSKKILYFIFWIGLLSFFEGTFLYSTNLLTYHNGWNFGWSIVVWIATFIEIRLHYTKPLWAWFICFICTAFLIIYFKIPISEIK